MNAAFAVSGGNSLQLNNFTQTSAESLTVQDTGTGSYQFVLSDGNWSGTDGGGVTGNNSNTLIVDKTLINNSIQINDSANIDFGITFDSSDFSGLSGSLDIIGAGAVSQNLGTTLKVSTFNVDAVSVSLGETTNNFGAVTVNVAADATLADTDDITLGNVTTGSAFQVTSGGVMTLTGNVSSGGTVMLTASGTGADIVMQPASVISTTADNVTLLADDSVQLAQVVAGGTSMVSVTATNGAITDADAADDTTPNIIGDNVHLQAATGIGASALPTFGDGEDIDINAGTLTATNTTSGSIQIDEVDDVALNQVSNPGGIVLIAAGGQITDGTPGDDSTVNIVADQAGLQAAGGIGDGVAGDLNDIDTNITTLAARTNTGDINIDETDTLSIGSVGGLNGVQITNSDGTATAGDDITVLAGGTLTVSQAVIDNDGGNIVLTAKSGNDLLVNADVLAFAPGNITLTGQNVTVDNSATVQITGTGTITSTTPKNGPVTGTGIITVNASAMTMIGATSTLRTGGGVIQITTDDLEIATGGLIAADALNGGVVMIRNASPGRDIELGGTVGGAVLNISNADLAGISADSLRIGLLDGVNDVGNITFTGTFSASAAMLPTVQLFAAGNITQNAGAGFRASNIGITTNGSVALGDPANDAINTLAVSAGGSVLFNDANSLTIGQVSDAVDNAFPADGETGVSGVTAMGAGNGFVDLEAQNGPLTVTADISAAGVNATNNLAVNLLAAAPNSAININAGANVASTAGAHRYTADNMDIQGTITASAADYSVNLRNATAGVAINLGSAGANAANNTLELSDAELDRITTNLLAIGRNTGNPSGNITLTDIVSPANTSTLHLITAGTVTDAGAGAVVVPNLLIEAGGGATLDNILSNDVDTLAGLIAGPGAALVFMDRSDVTVGMVNRLTVTNDANETAGLGMQVGIDTNGGNVQIVSNTGGVSVSKTIDTTADVSGQDSGAVTITALGTGGIVVDAPIVTTGITAAANGQGGDITLTTNTGSIQINTTTGSLNAVGGGAGAVDGGNITLDANGQNADVIVGGPITTNDVDDGTVRGSVTITADDAVAINQAISTQDPLDMGFGSITITANDSNLDGNGDGALTTSAGTITSSRGKVTLQTKADVSDDAAITVGQITTAGGAVLIDANGMNADVTLTNTVTTGDGGVMVLADDTVTFQSTAMIQATGTGDVTVQANADMSAGGGSNEILMADGSVIDAGSGKVTLQTAGTGGGNITLGRIVTTNATASAVTINSQMAVLDGGDTGGADIEALDTGSTINITAVTGVGTLADPIEASGVRFNVNNTGTGASIDPNQTFEVAINNSSAGNDVEIVQLAGASARTVINPGVAGSTITFNNTGGGLLTISNSGVSSGNLSNNVNGGDIFISTDGGLLVTAPLNTQGGSGGSFTVNGGATFDPGAAILLGAGNIALTDTGGTPDIVINTPLTISGSTALNAPRDIIVNTALTMSDAAGNLTLSADSDMDGVGGVVVRTAGQVVSANTLTMEGSDVFATTSVSAPIRDAVNIEGDGANVQVQSAGDLTIQNRASASANADVVLAGVIQSTSGNIFIDPNFGNIAPAADNKIHLAGDTTLTAAGDITFNGPVTDDGNNATASNLTVNTTAKTVFRGRVGDDVTKSATLPDRIDSLTTDPGGTTEIHGGFVSTVNFQTYGDNVLIDADAGGATTITAGGSVMFQGTVDGLDATANDDLVLDVTGTTTFADVVGGNQRIGDGTGPALSVYSDGETFFNSQVVTQSGLYQDNNAGRITFREDVNIAKGDTETFLNADVTLDSLTFFSDGNITFGSGPGLDNLYIEVGSLVDTRNSSGNVTVNSNITDPLATNQNLTFNLNQGDLIIAGSVGTAGNPLGNLLVQSANDFFFAPSGFQNMYVESLVQQTGIDAPGDTADTNLSGNVTALTGGINLSSTNVTYNANIAAQGAGTIVTQASFNITYTEFSSTTTVSGKVDSKAGHDIVMGEVLTPAMTTFVATIDANGNDVLLLAGNDLTVSQIRTALGYVDLTANGAVIDGGDLSGLASVGTIDIQAAQLQITANTGIAATGNMFLETMVSDLEAVNGTNGIFIANTGSLVIGDISPTTDGVSTFSGNIMIGATGNITLAEDIVITSTGQIVVSAGGNVEFDNQAKAMSSTGLVLQPSPLVPVQLIGTPQVDVTGLASLTFTVGLPGETNFVAVVDWGDGTATVMHVDAGQHTITHPYQKPPDAANPGADIRVLLVVTTDPNIHFFGANVPSLVTPNPPLPTPSGPIGVGNLLFPNPGDISPNDLVNRAIGQQDLGFFSVVVAFQVSRIQFGGVSVIPTPARPPFFIPGAATFPLLVTSTRPPENANDLESGGTNAEENAEGEVQVILRVFGPTGEKLSDQPIDSKYLADPTELWNRLPDGRYQIIVIEPGQTVGIVVRDVELKQHKVIRRFDKFRPNPNAEANPNQESSQAETPAANRPISKNSSGVNDNPDAEPRPAEAGEPVGEAAETPAGEAVSDRAWENWRPSPADRFSHRVADPAEDSARGNVVLPAAAVAGGLALGTLLPRTSRDADSRMMQFSKSAISPAARLRRRLRK